VRIAANVEAGCCRLGHPCRQAGERTVGLQHDDKLDAAAFEPASDLHCFAETRMEPIRDPSLNQLFVGSMSPF
jgi:hypothetical protein